MKNFTPGFWLRCAIVFILLIATRAICWRVLPNDDPEGGNLLVNAVLALIGTAAYAVGDICYRKYRRSQEEIQRKLKDKSLWN